jgi:tRNA-splicing ligase RtcB
VPASARPDMQVPARVFADEALFAAIERDGSLAQLENVATLPGSVDAALAMPDAHQGYGFPVGGVAATELPDGVVSPGGVGYDINCGVRLLALPLIAAELGERREQLVHELSRAIPAGAGKDSRRRSPADLDVVLREGPRAWAGEDDLERTESGGCLPQAEPTAVSGRAKERGAGPARDDGLGQPFRRAATGRAGRRPGDGAGVRAGRGSGDGADPLRLSRARPPGLHGLRQADGGRDAPLRDRAARSPARLRSRLVTGRGRVPGGDGGGGELCLGEPAGDRRCGARRGRTRARPRRLPPYAAGVRRRPQRRQGRALRRPRAARAPQGRNARLRRWLGRGAGAVPASRAAGLHPGEHGHGEPGAGGGAGLAHSGLRQHLPRRRQDALAHRSAQAGRRQRTATRARGTRHRRPLALEQGAGRGGAVRIQGRRPRRRGRPPRRSRAAGGAAEPLGVVKG